MMYGIGQALTPALTDASLMLEKTNRPTATATGVGMLIKRDVVDSFPALPDEEKHLSGSVLREVNTLEVHFSLSLVWN